MFGDSIIGAMHAKSAIYVHLFLSPALDRPIAEDVTKLIRRKFPGLEMVFGDEKSVSLFIVGSGFRPSRIIRFTVMDIARSRFHSIVRFPGQAPPAGAASLLVPLQIQYEIEEVGADYAQISRQKVKRVLEKKIQLGEITAIFNGREPVALAGVNARFGNTCQIGSVYVLPEYRGKGYGFSIISSHLERLFDRYAHIVLFVEENNNKARHIYEKIGFQCSGRLLQAYYS
jgi:GNAT superfamily N-acetyltransferase